MNHNELWEDRFDLFCDENRIAKEDHPNFYEFVRNAFRKGYAWGVADEYNEQTNYGKDLKQKRSWQ